MLILLFERLHSSFYIATQRYSVSVSLHVVEPTTFTSGVAKPMRVTLSFRSSVHRFVTASFVSVAMPPCCHSTKHLHDAIGLTPRLSRLSWRAAVYAQPLLYYFPCAKGCVQIH